MDGHVSKLPVPLFIWDSLMATMKHQSRKLTEDIAKSLGQDPAALWKEISKQNFEAYLVDMTEPTDEKFLCQSYCSCGLIEKPCKKPVIFGQKYCAEHSSKPQIRPSIQLQKLRTIKYCDEETGDILQVYLNPSTNEIFSMETLEQIGEWDHEEKKLFLFEKSLN